MPRSLSPVSVPYRVLQRGGGIAIAFVFAMSGGFDIPGVGLAGPLALFAVAAVGALALIGYETAYVRRFSYDLGSDTLDIDSGVISQRSREIPIGRIQNVDISRNVLQRVFGIAVVAFETAGGGDTEAFVSFEEAKRLQARLGRLKRVDGEPLDGDRDGETADIDGDAASGEGGAGDPADRVSGSAGRRFDAPAVTELFSLDRTELAIVGALSVDFRVPGVLFLLASTAGSAVVPTYLSATSGAAFVAGGAAVLLGVALLSWVVGAAAAVAQYYDFRLVRSGDELQYERGLLQRYDGSIPFDKIQTLTVADNPLKRYFGYATLYIETAGYAPGGSGGSSRGSEAAVPLAERDRVLELIEELEPVGDVTFQRPPKRARRRYLVRYLAVVGDHVRGEHVRLASVPPVVAGASRPPRGLVRPRHLDAPRLLARRPPRRHPERSAAPADQDRSLLPDPDGDRRPNRVPAPTRPRDRDRRHRGVAVTGGTGRRRGRHLGWSRRRRPRRTRNPAGSRRRCLPRRTRRDRRRRRVRRRSSRYRSGSLGSDKRRPTTE